MKLSHAQISDIAFGAAYISNDNQRTVFHRFTKAQEEFYKTVSDDFYNKCFATSGVHLDFYTNSRYIELKVFVKQRSSRRFLSHTIFADGTHVGSLDARFEDIPGTLSSGYLSGRFALGSDNRSRRISVFLPWSFSSEICELTIEDGSTLSPALKKIKMICFGDSITQGYDAEIAHNPYATAIANELDANARNRAIGGERFRPDLAKLADDGFEPDVITVAYGTNDWCVETSREAFEKNCSGFYRELTENYPKAKIFAISPIWRADNSIETSVGKFEYVSEFIKSFAEGYSNITFIDGYRFVPQDTELFGDKYLHPNDEGFKYYAKNLIKEIKKYL